MEQLKQRGEGSSNVQRATQASQALSNKIRNPITQLLKGVGYLVYVRMPTWVQHILNRAYEIASGYKFLVDFSVVFSLLFAMPFTIFLIWSIGSLVVTMVLWAIAYVAINGLSIGIGLMCISPVFVTLLFITFCITLVITIIRLISYGSSFVYKYISSFLQNRVDSDLYKEDARLRSTRNVRFYDERREECPSI
ncbi:hypothetical protein C1646_730476 [Rhizophagus diaphanus]|nr:hypothetical protein C1646_730476 [Rhizophagus diaphanus] [Rhizophagus sp. MUCL 43196]